MLTPMMGNRGHYAQMLWGADTGCFAAPKKHTDDGYLRWLDSMAHYRFTNLFATAPDVVGDGRRTLERAYPMLPRIRECGYRPALVAQDGMEELAVEWSLFDVLFIGGSTEWKMSDKAIYLVRQAALRGKWIHMGRVNSFKRLRYASQIGCASADGTYLKYGPTKLLPNVERWMQDIRSLEMNAAA